MRERAAGEPQARLLGAHPHVAQFLCRLFKTPDAADTFSDIVAEQRADHVALAFVAGGKHDEVGVAHRAIVHCDAASGELLDVGGLNEADPAVRDQFRAADVEVIAAAALTEFQRPAGAVLAEFKPEAGLLQSLKQRRVDLAYLVGDDLVRDFHHRQRHR